MRYDGLIIPRTYNDYFPRSNPAELVNALLNSGETWPVASGGTGANNAAAARENLGIITDTELNVNSNNPVANKVIAKLIPATASEENKLTDENFVNSSISTNTANYIFKTNAAGDNIPFDSVEELEAYSGTVTNNDYAFVTGTDAGGNPFYDRYKATVEDSVVTWAKEYRLNNSSFTAEQWAAIESGITAELVAQIGGGSALVPSITQSEYDELPEEEKTNGQIREITDAEGYPVPFAILNDELTTSANVLSAQETENRISSLQTYIKNQNILSDAERIGSGSYINGWTAQYDGFIYIFRNSGAGWEGSISDGTTSINIGNTILQGGSISESYPFKKGDVIYVSGNSNDGTIYVRQYKLRDYTGR